MAPKRGAWRGTELLVTHKSNCFHAPWHDRRDDAWLRRLAAGGARPEEVDFVLCTHLHLDHCGWHTRLVDGRWVPTFPNAKYLFAREEFEHRQSCADLTFVENVVPVMEAGQGVIVAMDHALDDEVWLVPTPGPRLDSPRLEGAEGGDDG